MAAVRRPEKKHRKKPDPLALAVGQRVRRLRDERDFTFDAFVEETGLGRGYISELERGLVVPSLHALAKLAMALELTVADLVVGDSPRETLFGETLGLTTVQLTRLRRVVAQMRGGVPPTDAKSGGSPVVPLVPSTSTTKPRSSAKRVPGKRTPN